MPRPGRFAPSPWNDPVFYIGDQAYHRTGLYGCGNSRPQRDSIPRPSSLQQVPPTTLYKPIKLHEPISSSLDNVQCEYSITRCARNPSNSFGVNTCKQKERQVLHWANSHLQEHSISISLLHSQLTISHRQKNICFRNVFPKTSSLIMPNGL